MIDGTGRAAVGADVAIRAGRIEAVGPGLAAEGGTVIDVGGLVVAPGFIDIHSHTDLELLIDPRAESKVRQGVTTEVAGQDGSSLGPWTNEQWDAVRDTNRRRYGIDVDFRDVGGFFVRLEREPGAVNFASMIGAGTVRNAVIGADDRRATPDELHRMVGLVAEALGAGACGLSTGLEYIPGAFADLNELIALAAPLGGSGLPYASHMRNEDDQLLAAVEEALNVGRLAGVSVQISHLKAQGERNWWKAPVVLDLLEWVRADGVDVTYDRYPYVAYSTGLTSLFPVWARDGGNDRLLGRLDDPSLAARIEDGVRAKIDQLGSWNAVQITSAASPALAAIRGRRLGDLAREQGMEPYAYLVRLTREDRARTGMIGFGMSEENTERFLAHPLGMICSDGTALAVDGPLAGGSPHPRSFGTFARVLGHYARDRGTLPLELAVHKMTGMPATRLRFTDRGRIAPGGRADLAVFDPDRIADRATFQDPHRYAAGVPHVLVNGEFVLRDHEHTGARPGQVVRPAR